MKLIIRQYLESLKERNELDAILPDLLSQLGLNVYSTPGRGTRQDGVDVGAVGKLEGDTNDKIYLFSIKAGDLTRNDWNTASPQSLRPSLDQILDSYIPTRLPVEHKNKDIVICLCFGGEIKEQLRSEVKGYIDKQTTGQITFEEWNGDKLADLIQSSFLREELMPNRARSHLRKALALIDEPQASFIHFSDLIHSLSDVQIDNEKDCLTAIRQLNICLWIHYAWAREAQNIESTYLASEISLLYGWEITKSFADKSVKTAKAIQEAFHSIANLYHLVCFTFLEDKVLPFVSKRHAISVAVQGSCDLDVNLRLFDILGRLAMGGLWAHLMIQRTDEKDDKKRNVFIEELRKYAVSIKQLISNNPSLMLPIKDDQAIDVSLAMLLLLIEGDSNKDISRWAREIMNRAIFAHKANRQYPCNINSYLDLLDHPVVDDNYLKENTCGSILYPMLGLFAAIIVDTKLYELIQEIKKDHLGHCNFQLWFPSEDSEEHLYVNSDGHGAVLSQINVDQSLSKFAELVFGECDQSNSFSQLTAEQFGLWPLILVACRQYRLPVPVHFFRYLRPNLQAEEAVVEAAV